MKQKLYILPLMLMLASCANFNPTNPTTTVGQAKAIVTDAKKLEIVAGKTMDQFLYQEDKIRDLTKAHAPAVHQTAEYLRVKVPYSPCTNCDIKTKLVPRDVALVLTLGNAIKVFEASETPEGAANLITAYNTLKDLYDRSKDGLLKISNLTP